MVSMNSDVGLDLFLDASPSDRARNRRRNRAVGVAVAVVCAVAVGVEVEVGVGGPRVRGRVRGLGRRVASVADHHQLITARMTLIRAARLSLIHAFLN